MSLPIIEFPDNLSSAEVLTFSGESMIVKSPQGTLYKIFDYETMPFLPQTSIDATLEETDWFLREYGKVNENVVSYMYNLLALEQIAYPNRSNYEILYSLGRESEIPGFNNEVGRVVEKSFILRNLMVKIFFNMLKKGRFL